MGNVVSLGKSFSCSGRHFTEEEEFSIMLLAEALCPTFDVERKDAYPSSVFSTLIVHDLNRPSNKDFLFTVSKRMGSANESPRYHMTFSTSVEHDQFYIETVDFSHLVDMASGKIKYINACAKQAPVVPQADVLPFARPSNG